MKIRSILNKLTGKTTKVEIPEPQPVCPTVAPDLADTADMEPFVITQDEQGVFHKAELPVELRPDIEEEGWPAGGWGAGVYPNEQEIAKGNYPTSAPSYPCSDYRPARTCGNRQEYIKETYSQPPRSYGVSNYSGVWHTQEEYKQLEAENLKLKRELSVIKEAMSTFGINLPTSPEV